MLLCPLIRCSASTIPKLSTLPVLRSSVLKFPPQKRYKSSLPSEILSNATTPHLDQLSSITGDQIGHFQSVGLNESLIWPTGVFQHVFEYVHVYTGLPWWATIIGVTIAVRGAMLPLYIQSSKTNSKMNLIKPQLEKIAMKAKSPDPQIVQQAMLEQHQLMKTHQIQPINMLKPMLSVPLFFGIFNSLRGMANVPVDGFTTQGLLWFPNLAIADPYCALQVATAGIYALSFRYLGQEMMQMQQSQQQVQQQEQPTKQTENFMQRFSLIMPFIAVPLTRTLPAGICLYFATNAVLGVIQSLILKKLR